MSETGIERVIQNILKYDSWQTSTQLRKHRKTHYIDVLQWCGIRLIHGEVNQQTGLQNIPKSSHSTWFFWQHLAVQKGESGNSMNSLAVKDGSTQSQRMKGQTLWYERWNLAEAIYSFKKKSRTGNQFQRTSYKVVLLTKQHDNPGAPDDPGAETTKGPRRPRGPDYQGAPNYPEAQISKGPIGCRLTMCQCVIILINVNDLEIGSRCPTQVSLVVRLQADKLNVHNLPWATLSKMPSPQLF